MTKNTKIKNRVIKMEMVRWKDLQWLQVSLKDLSEEACEKLKCSLVNNDFSMPFHVWRDKEGSIHILDGHHRQKAMLELEVAGVEIPVLLPAVFVRCRDKKEASKLVLVYSSIYAGVTTDGLVEFLKANDLDWNELRGELDIPDVNLDYFFEEPEALPDVDIEGESVASTEYLIIVFKDTNQYREVREKIGLKGLVRNVPFDKFVERIIN